MFCCLLKKELTFTLSRLGTNCVSFSQVKFLVFEAQPVFSKLSEAAPLDERGRISITSTPSLHYRTRIVSSFHELPTGGHLGFTSTSRKLLETVVLAWATK